MSVYPAGRILGGPRRCLKRVKRKTSVRLKTYPSSPISPPTAQWVHKFPSLCVNQNTVWNTRHLEKSQSRICDSLTVFLSLDMGDMLRPAMIAIRELKLPMLKHSRAASIQYSMTLTRSFFLTCCCRRNEKTQVNTPTKIHQHFKYTHERWH